MKLIMGITVFVGLIAGLIYLFGESDGKSSESIKIGALLPLSGIAANYGEGSREGIEIAKEDLRSKYPSMNIEVIYEDSFYDPKRAVDGYRKLKDINNILAVLTGGSQVSSAVKNLSDKDSVLQMAIWSGAPSYSAGSHNYNFRITALSDEHVPILTNYINTRNYKKLALIYANNEFGVAFKDSFEKNSKTSDFKIIPYGIGNDDMEFRTVLLKIKNEKPDSIFFVGLVKQFINILKQSSDLGIKTQFFSQWSVEDQQLLDGARDLAEGVIYAYPFDETDDASAEFLKKYSEKYNKVPSAYAAEAYTGLILLGETINACHNKADPVCWRDYLNKIKDLPTIIGSVSFDNKGDLKGEKIFLKTVKDGRFVKAEE